MLRNTLKSFISQVELAGEEYLTRRPEELSVRDFVILTNRIEEAQKV
jgi:16S rRNA A1518/A1519 N6-dimethyltransferase RsmA/KsgA/DIM1 with predicted DNA glycosylase/AP lyase activity